MQQLQSSISHDIAGHFLSDLEWLDCEESIDRLLTPEALDAFNPSARNRLSTYSAFRSAYDNYIIDSLTPMQERVKADSDKTQRIFDYYYDVLDYRLALTKQLDPSHTYMYDFARGIMNVDTAIASGIIATKDQYLSYCEARMYQYRNRYDYKYCYSSYMLPPVALYYTMIAVLYDNDNIVGFRLYDWVTDTAADYTYESVKQRLIEASVRITNIEAIGRGTNKQIVCTQGKFEYYTRLNAKGESVNFYRPLVYLTSVSSVNGGGIFVSYLGSASLLPLNSSLLSVGVANLVLLYFRRDKNSFKPATDALPFGVEPLKPGEDYVGNVYYSKSDIHIAENDVNTYGVYRAYAAVGFQSDTLEGALSESKSLGGNRVPDKYVFAGYGFGLLNNVFSQFITPVQRHFSVNTSGCVYDSAIRLRDASSPLFNIAGIFPVYPVITFQNNMGNVGTQMATTEGVIIKSSDLSFHDRMTTLNNMSYAFDEVETHNGKKYIPLHDLYSFLGPRGFFEIPLFFLKIINRIADLTSNFNLAGTDDARNIYVHNERGMTYTEIRYDSSVVLSNILTPIFLRIADAKQLKIEGSLSDVELNGGSKTVAYSNVVLNELDPFASLRLYSSSNAFVKNLTVNGNMKQLVNNAFGNNTKLEVVALPDTIEIIGSRAFYRQSKLKYLNIPKSTKIINSSAFFLCEKLANIELPEGLCVIGANAFAGCESLGTIVIPSTVTFIGAGAFRDCNLQNVIFKGDISKIDIVEGAFEGNSVAVENMIAPYEGKTFQAYNGNLLVERTERNTKLSLTAGTTEKPTNKVYSKHIEKFYQGYSFERMYFKNPKLNKDADGTTNSVKLAAKKAKDKA